MARDPLTGPGFAVDQPERRAGPGQPEGEGQAGRAGPDDQHLGFGHYPSLVVTFCPDVSGLFRRGSRLTASSC
jgi:hypothetical protein